MSKPSIAAGLIACVLTVAGAIFMGLRDGNKANTTLLQLQRSNDSLTKVLSVTLQRTDSLQHLVVLEAARADSFATLSANTTSKIAGVEHRRKKIPVYIKQLPDTGVARTFQELLQ